jgi:hypothetical protein
MADLGRHKIAGYYTSSFHPKKLKYNKYINIYIYVYSSSTAQGGGGSFKNRKPIGEVRCCESGMAERFH